MRIDRADAGYSILPLAPVFAAYLPLTAAMSFYRSYSSLSLLPMLLCGVLCSGMTSAFAARSVVVLPVYEQPAANVVEVLRPLLGRGSSITAHGNQLIINASTSELHAIREALLRLDQPARRILIEVRTITDDHALPDGSQVRYYRSTNDYADTTQRVQTLDGQAAFIRTGHITPVTQYAVPWVTPDGRLPPPVLPQTTERVSTQGFYALPHLHGEQVTIDIQQWNERAPMNNALSETQVVQQAETTVRGRLGEWITLGDSMSSEQIAGAQGMRIWSTQQHAAMGLQLRVTELPQ